MVMICVCCIAFPICRLKFECHCVPSASCDAPPTARSRLLESSWSRSALHQSTSPLIIHHHTQRISISCSRLLDHCSYPFSSFGSLFIPFLPIYFTTVSSHSFPFHALP